MTGAAESACPGSGISDAARTFRSAQGAQTHIWLAQVARLSCAQALQNDELLDQDEQARSARLIQPVQRQMFDRSHRFLRHLLSHYASCPAAEIVYARQPRGKPVLMGAHSGLTFSLSHSTRYCAIAIAGGPQIGVDIEERGDFIPSDGDPCLGLGNVLSDAERRALAELPHSWRVSALLQFWTLKEAAVKATGDGLHGQLARYSFAGMSESRLAVPSGYGTLHCRALPLPAGVIGAFASLGTDTDFTLKWF